MRVEGFWVPPSVALCEMRLQCIGGVEILHPRLTPSLLTDLLNSLRTARERSLRRSPLSSLLSVVDTVVARWQDRTGPWRREIEEALAAVTPFSRPMVSHGVDLMLEGFRRDPLAASLGKEGIEEARDAGPALTSIVLAGNIPLLGISPLVFTLLARSACLIKMPEGDPLSLALFARALAEEEPLLGECIAALRWIGGTESLEEEVFSRSDAVVAFGGEQALQSIQSRVRSRFIGYGPRVSLGIIGREALREVADVARRAAYDVSIFDQRGCLSPHLLYIEEGGPLSPREFAISLAEAMQDLTVFLPPGRPSPAEAAAVRQVRGAYEMRTITGKETAVYTSPEGVGWTVIYDAGPLFPISPGSRTVFIQPVASLGVAEERITPVLYSLQAVGLALSPERALPLGERLTRVGVPRVCWLGEMQHPCPGWPQDGQPLLAELRGRGRGRGAVHRAHTLERAWSTERVWTTSAAPRSMSSVGASSGLTMP